ncbi:MAG: Bifunctional ligase/repressor BirA [Catillopecten margaritatus gill symbiont]|uniref:Bifunctional ligase/repressor BirA n=1 Tax=Catillopecten margaritatus gill symbiont TaxID=3083288 RepID=A0AAU6PHF6_9GAMM
MVGINVICGDMVDYSDLKAHLSGDIDCHIFDSIPSTSDYLSSLAFSKRTQVCVTTQQTQGKGQHNRRWLSHKNSSVLLSVRRVFSTDVNLNGLSLVVGLALIEVLDVADLKLKWPNDVYYQGKKLAGILIENSIQKQTQSVVIGIGLNVDVDIDCQTPWIDLHSISEDSVNQVELSKDLIDKILQFCRIFEIEGFAYFSQHWKSVDYLKGKQLQYDDKKHAFSGVCLGVDKEGVLLVETKSTIKQIYSSKFLQILQ